MTSTEAIGPRSGKGVIRVPRTAHPRFLSTSRLIALRALQPPPTHVLNSNDRSFEDILNSIAEFSTDEAIRPRGVEGVDSVQVSAHSRFISAPRQPVMKGPHDLKIALIQLAVGPDKSKNIADAVRKIHKAKEKGANLVVLPESFNSPYGIKYFDEYAEQVPSGETCTALSLVAAETCMFVVGGTIPERCGLQLFNTCTVWDRSGDLVAIHRKKPFCDKDEPESFVVEDRVTTFNCSRFKIGIGICNDLRLFDMTALMAQEGCSFVIYLGAFDMTTGPKQWELLGRARAIDLQLWVALVSPARDTKADYIAWGHTMLIDPWGKVVASLDLRTVEKVRRAIPVRSRGSAEI